MKAWLKRHLPSAALASVRRARRYLARRRDGGRSLEAVFSEVYAENRWGGASGEFDSGSGSVEEQTQAYAALVRQFIEAHGVRTVVDLGCGDYRVGRATRAPGVRYVGIDVVPALIERNRRDFGGPETEFLCLDAVRVPLPAGELCLVRQVLQHLSNAEIAAILERTRSFRWVLVTEHLPAPEHLTSTNRDKPHGPDTRVVDGSGVFVCEPPFSMTGRVVLRSPVAAPLVARGEVLETLLLEPGPSRS